MTGDLTYAGVTIFYTGGGAPFPTSYRYESAVKDLGNIVGFGALSWTSRQGDVKVQMRTCEAACTTEAWADVENGAVPAVSRSHSRNTRSNSQVMVTCRRRSTRSISRTRCARRNERKNEGPVPKYEPHENETESAR